MLVGQEKIEWPVDMDTTALEKSADSWITDAYLQDWHYYIAFQ